MPIQGIHSVLSTSGSSYRFRASLAMRPIPSLSRLLVHRLQGMTRHITVSSSDYVPHKFACIFAHTAQDNPLKKLVFPKRCKQTASSSSANEGVI